MSLFSRLFEWSGAYDAEDFFDEGDSSEEELLDVEEEDSSDVDKRDPSRGVVRKRQLSGGVTPPVRPKLQRVMSNSEKQMCLLGEYHVNDKKPTTVNMATPGNPDHTYSAVGFNIHGQPTGNVVRIKGFSIGGMLSRVRIYMCKNTICHLIREDETHWTKIYDQQHEEAWKNNVDVMLEEPVIIPPTENVAFYIHSDRQDDLGLKYRSCHARRAIIHRDDFILITRGFAHTSPVPFNLHNGWFRENRVLSGDVYYDAIPIRWTNYSHDCFPDQFKQAVHQIRESLVDCKDWHEHVVDNIIELLPFDHFGQEISADEFMQEVAKDMEGIGRSPYGDFW